MSRKALCLMTLTVIGTFALPSGAITQEIQESGSAYDAASKISDILKQQELAKRQEICDQALENQTKTIQHLHKAVERLNDFSNFQEVVRCARILEELLKKFKFF
jgi:DNA-binding transcriptional regulator GbsR (MarR family)